MTKVICFANNKGGSGKTTTCANVGYGLAQLGKKILFIDGDMQMNLSLSYFDEEYVLETAQSKRNLYYAIKKQESIEEYIVQTIYENIDMVLSSSLMSSIEYELFTKWQREYILKKCIQNIKDSEKYDYILIDAPPTLGGWVMNILCASDVLIIPVEATPWGLFGLGNLFEFLEEVKTVTLDLKSKGLVMTKADIRKNYFKQTKESLQQIKDIRLFHTYIRVDSNIEWSQDNNKPVMDYKKSSRSAKEYLQLAEEIMNSQYF